MMSGTGPRSATQGGGAFARTEIELHSRKGRLLGLSTDPRSSTPRGGMFARAEIELHLREGAFARIDYRPVAPLKGEGRLLTGIYSPIFQILFYKKIILLHIYIYDTFLHSCPPNRSTPPYIFYTLVYRLRL